VRRQSGERVLPWGLVIPGGEDHGTAHVGVVVDAGPGRRVRERVLPMECAVGDVVLYSSRTDAFVLGDGSHVDVVEEASVIGVF
jgi:co-chaperonin GroES (HSP10)